MTALIKSSHDLKSNVWFIVPTTIFDKIKDYSDIILKKGYLIFSNNLKGFEKNFNKNLSSDKKKYIIVRPINSSQPSETKKIKSYNV